MRILKTLAVVAVTWAAGCPALAQELGKPGAASLYAPPSADEVASAPSDAEVTAAWPAKAAAQRTPGSAVAHCLTGPSGVLSDCQLTVQRPSNGEFGAALLALAPKYRLKPVPEAKRPAGTGVVITATWPVADTPPNWRVPPKPGDFATTATTAAWKSGETGRVVMNCMLGKLGTLYQCMVVYQHPAGKGFGTMMLRFADYLRLKPALLAGKPVLSGVNIVFDLEKSDAPI
jgi:hypothetical protein